MKLGNYTLRSTVGQMKNKQQEALEVYFSLHAAWYIKVS